MTSVNAAYAIFVTGCEQDAVDRFPLGEGVLCPGEGTIAGRLFGEDHGRVLVAYEPSRRQEVEATINGVALQIIGKTGGDRLHLADVCDVSVVELASAWSSALGDCTAYNCTSVPGQALQSLFESALPAFAARRGERPRIIVHLASRELEARWPEYSCVVADGPTRVIADSDQAAFDAGYAVILQGATDALERRP